MIANKDEALIRAIRNHCCSGKGKGVTLEELSVTQNGEYTPDSGKAYSKVSVNVSGGGSGKVNINDIILADDLLEKCQGLEYGDSGRYRKCTTDTGWTFSDICVQDSCGVLQNAFENIVIDENNNWITKQVAIVRFNETGVGLTASYNSGFPQGMQCIHIQADGFWYEIIYNPTTQKYEAYWCTNQM